MTYTTTAKKDALRGIIDTDKLSDTTFKITITPISEDEADEMEFKSLKGIYGKAIDLDEIRKERLGLWRFY